jgi:pimeloyl-ACP methyl ester carboxylesterase
MPRSGKKKTPKSRPRAERDLSQGVIVVFSGGPVDIMNPKEVRDRMDQLIRDVNSDPFVAANTGGKGLTFKLLSDLEQPSNHIHQAFWPAVFKKLTKLKPSPLILVGHSNGGAAVMNLARRLQEQDQVVDFAITADSVFTIVDNGDPNKVPSNVLVNLNPYTIPTDEFWLLPFPIGRASQRKADGSLDGILNVGLPFVEPGAIAHRDVFYDLAGGDQSVDGAYAFPEMMLDTILAALRGATTDEIFRLAQADLQILANEVRIPISLETTGFSTTLIPAASRSQATTPPRVRPLGQSQLRKLNPILRNLELQRQLAFKGR